eukprot:SM000088S23701  [mRNA]  locus=s88:188553:189238:- [translate_table: standard]
MDVTNDDDPAVPNLLPGEDCMSRPGNRQPAGAAPLLYRAGRLGVRPKVRTDHVWPLHSPLLSAGLFATMRVSCCCYNSQRRRRSATAHACILRAVEAAALVQPRRQPVSLPEASREAAWPAVPEEPRRRSCRWSLREQESRPDGSRGHVGQKRAAQSEASRAAAAAWGPAGRQPAAGLPVLGAARLGQSRAPLLAKNRKQKQI